MNGKSTAANPEEYLAAVEEPRQSQIRALYDLIREAAPDLAPHMRSGMIGFGTFHYKGKSGREGDWFKLALASNKNTIMFATCAMIPGGYMAEAYKERLPKAKIGRSCINFKRLEDVDLDVIREIVRRTAEAEF